MKLNEFKAWFEGYTEDLKGSPNKDQWAKIVKRVKEIDGTPITEKVFVDHYWPNYINWAWQVYPQKKYPDVVYLSTNGTSTVTPTNTVFSSTSAMYNLGKEDWKASCIASG